MKNLLLVAACVALASLAAAKGSGKAGDGGEKGAALRDLRRAQQEIAAELEAGADELTIRAYTRRLRELREEIAKPPEDMSSLLRKSLEGATKGNLGAIRSALSIFYGDKEGLYPKDVRELTEGGRYVRDIPLAKTGHHPPSARVTDYPSMSRAGLRDTGGWGYVSATETADHGSFFVDCTHTDSKGSVWTSY